MSLKEFARNLVRPIAVGVAGQILRAPFVSAPHKKTVWDKLTTYFTYRDVAGWRRTVWGDALFCDASDFIQKHVYFFGCWEPALTQYIRSLKKSDGVFVDIGANIGYFSLLGSTVFDRVVSFEASPAIHRLLSANINYNRRGNIDARNVAIGAAHGEVHIRPGPAGNIGMTSIARGAADDAASSADVETVQMAPLEGQFDPADLAAIRLIKIDVEGAEPGVVESLLKCLPQMSRDLELVIEVTPDAGAAIREMYDDLCRAGFEPYVIAGVYDFADYAAPQREPAQPIRAQGFPEAQTDILFRRTA